MRILRLSYCLAVIMTIAGPVGGQTSTIPAPKPAKAPPSSKPTAPAKVPAKAPAAKPAPAPSTAAVPTRAPGLYARLQTSLGTIVFQMFENQTPRTVQNFQDLAVGRKFWTDPRSGERVKKPLYPGTIFHRVIPGFMIQGGDPTGTGQGSSDYIGEEYHPTLKFDRPGRVAMARTQVPGSSSCQFFIMDGPRSDLDGRYTIFGQVISGQEVVNKIANLPRNDRDRPNTPPKILAVTFNRVKA